MVLAIPHCIIIYTIIERNACLLFQDVYKHRYFLIILLPKGEEGRFDLENTLFSIFLKYFLSNNNQALPPEDTSFN
jgi:hypothetical protein